jgi:hypothetical protein
MRTSVRRRAVWFVLLAAILGSALVSPAVGRAQDAPKVAALAAPEPAAKGQEVRPAALGPREKVGLYVFMSGLWLAIAFLLYFLRLRIREADRVFGTGLYRDAGGVKGPRRS